MRQTINELTTKWKFINIKINEGYPSQALRNGNNYTRTRPNQYFSSLNKYGQFTASNRL